MKSASPPGSVVVDDGSLRGNEFTESLVLMGGGDSNVKAWPGKRSPMRCGRGSDNATTRWRWLRQWEENGVRLAPWRAFLTELNFVVVVVLSGGMGITASR